MNPTTQPVRVGRPSPPPLVWDSDAHHYRCPLCTHTTTHMRLADQVVLFCPDCCAYWFEAAVIRGRDGAWDDHGTQCPATHVLNVTGGDRPLTIGCVLGDTHTTDGADRAGCVVHIDRDGLQWNEPHTHTGDRTGDDGGDDGGGCVTDGWGPVLTTQRDRFGPVVSR